ncbi:MAG TPA: hypothetical protein VE934_08050 [Polaromonas sp.]|uniref:hypothetical protein n=1 Tax=Polaromonas sp. TaxID=1869339 RepID=UPI002D2A52A2|nr:hypothetical protein [Polaromonas sp.]HYW56897.1 hypothetical protein [Polaromonas sp.]
MTNKEVTAALDRLAQSRLAIVRHMHHDTLEAVDTVEGLGQGDREEIDGSSGTWGLVKQVTTSWWRGHPAHMALDFLKPMVQSYAEDKPVRMLGISAAIGAAIVVIRPWRLMSLTGVLIAVAKSKELSEVVRSMTGSHHPNNRYR